jgi:hypothetical protein
MEFTVNENGVIQLEKVYNSIILKTSSNEELSICMRDSGFEFTYQNKNYYAKEGIIGTFNQKGNTIIVDSKESAVTTKKEIQKLEPKHLFPYLEYNLKLERINYKNERYKTLSTYDLIEDGEIDNILPLLIPLSNLKEKHIEEIIVNCYNENPNSNIIKKEDNNVWLITEKESDSYFIIDFSDINKL